MSPTQISGWQLCLLIIGAITVMGHLFIVPLVLDRAGRDAWVALLVALVPGIFLVLILSGLALLKPQHSLDQIASNLFGRWAGKIVALVYTVYFLLPATLATRGLMEFMGTAFLPDTPKGLIGGAFLVLCLLAVRSGLENIARAYAILMPVLLFMGLLAACLAAPEKEYYRLLPILEHGFTPVWLGSVPLMGLLGELLVLGAIQGTVKNQANLWQFNLVIVLMIGLLFVGPLTGPVAMFGETGAVKFDYPTFAEMKFGNYLVDFQSLAVVLWLWGSFGRIALFYYAATDTASRLLAIEDYRRLAIPTGLIIFLLVQYAFPDLATIKKFLVDSYPLMGLSLGILLPMIMLLFCWQRRTN